MGLDTIQFGDSIVATRGPSPTVFANMDLERAVVSGQYGYGIFNDFMNSTGGITTFLDTGVTARLLGTAGTSDGGVIRILHDTTANDEGHFGITDGFGAPFNFSSTAPRALAFEARFRVSSVANTTLPFFVGLGAPGLVATGQMDDTTGELADKDFIGFQTLVAAGATMLTSYKKNGQTKQAPSGNNTTIVADTWYKVGFRFDPGADNAKRLVFFRDGVALPTEVTATDFTAVTFPDDVPLCPVVLTQNDGGAANHISVDWIAVYQDRA